MRIFSTLLTGRRRASEDGDRGGSTTKRPRRKCGALNSRPGRGAGLASQWRIFLTGSRPDGAKGLQHFVEAMKDRLDARVMVSGFVATRADASAVDEAMRSGELVDIGNVGV